MSIHKKASSTIAVGLVATLALTACSSDGPSAENGDATGTVNLTLLVDVSDQSMNIANAVVDAFNESQDGIEMEIESRPGGTDGDNLIKTRLATGEMNDVFNYNSGSLFAALDPANNLVALTDQPFMEGIDETFKTATKSGDDFYGVPFEQAMGGGILYNKSVYADLGLEVPKTWDQFMDNNAKIKEAGIDPVIQTYADTWTSQLFVLADFHNVSATQPDWAEKYTANEAKFAEEPALKGFERLQEVYDAGYLNKDFASATQSQGMQQLVDGTGAHYPMLTFAISSYVDLAEDAAENIGFFAQPGDDEGNYGLTAWTPGGFYVPKSTEGQQLDAVMTFLEFAASPAACDAVSDATTPNGPYMITECQLPDGLPAAVGDLQQYFTDGNASPALEFLSPIKGPNLEKIAVEVGSGITPAAEGAARYDEDVKKQAQQLGLEGW